MKYLFFLVALFWCSPSPATDLRRTWKNPNPDPVSLVKNFFEEREVDSTCYEEQCETVDGDCEKLECTDRTVTRQVCTPVQQCTTDDDGNNVCTSHDECHDETEVIPNDDCWHVHYRCPQQSCQQVGHACKERKKVLLRSWKVQAKVNFDPRALPKKGKEEKFTLNLDGDEHGPKLVFQKVAGPFEYSVAPKFSADAKSVTVELTLLPPKAPPAQ